MKVTLAVLHLSLRSFDILYICMPHQARSHHSMKHFLVATKKRLVQGCKNAVAPRATKNVECAKVFLPFVFHAYECCMEKLVCVRY